MKTKDIKHKFVAFLCVAACVGFTACETDPIEMQSGKQPDKEPIENVHGKLRGATSTGNTINVLLTEGDGFATKGFYYQQSKPTATGFSLTAWINNNLLGDYNAAEEVERHLLPEANYEFPDGKTLDLSADGQRSILKRIKFLASGLAAGEYVLPLTVAEEGTSDADKTLYYNVTIRQPQLGDHELLQDEDLFFVFYINTDTYDPRLVDEYFMQKKKIRNATEPEWYRTIGNIVNLRTVTINYDAATGRALLNLGNDMRYVLDHATTYIRPLQDKGRKVCLCLEGGGTGLGFCNLNDQQINDFVMQVKNVIDEYELDGVNLWDRNSGYGKSGMPAMNTTSYPKLIKALSEALGDEKLLTLADHEEPTEYFWNTEATDGIEVGQYIDYAWSGYRSGDEPIQICDPYNIDLGATMDEWGFEISHYTHKPIAGLDPSCYGCINVPWYKAPDEDDDGEWQDVGPILEWVMNECKQSNILVFEDLRTVLQDAYEGTWDLSGAVNAFMEDGEYSGRNGYRYSFDSAQLANINGVHGYGKWLKDW